MNIGLLQCDRVDEKYAPEHGQYPDMFATLLKQVDPTITFTIYDALHDDLPANADACDAYLITGSRHGVNDDLPWIAKLEHFIRTLHARQKKIIGICFGHQLIAKALGGRVSKSPSGWGVGMSHNTITQKKSWMVPTRDAFNVLISHQDQVVALPPEAEVLASNETCPVFMMQIGRSFTVQGHPEFSKGYSAALIKGREDILGDLCYKRGMTSLQLPADDALIAQWIINFLNHDTFILS